MASHLAPAAGRAAAAAAASGAAEEDHFEVVVVGSGFSGLLCLVELQDAGIDLSSEVRLFEMTPAVGGVWSSGGVGAYPGAACDVPSYVYLPLLDRTGFIPSKKYVSQPEISACKGPRIPMCTAAFGF